MTAPGWHLLLDSGCAVPTGYHHRPKALALLRVHNSRAREAKRRGDIVYPRLAVGIIKRRLKR